MVFKCDDIDTSVLTWMLLKVNFDRGTFSCSTFEGFASNSCENVQWYMLSNLRLESSVGDDA